MNRKLSIVSSIILFTIFSNIQAQDSLNHCMQNESSIGIKGGLSYIVVQDKFLSNQKYSGTAASFIIEWSQRFGSRIVNISMEGINLAEIDNDNNATAEVTEMSFNYSYLYSIGGFNLFDRKFEFHIGPNPDLYVHYRNQNIADGGLALFDAYSAAFLFSLGMRTQMTVPVIEKLNVESSLFLSMISLGGKFVDPREGEDHPIKFLTLFSGLRSSFSLGLNYKIDYGFSASIGYKLNLASINAWDYFISTNDNFLLTLKYSF